MSTKPAKTTEPAEADKDIDSLGQENPARDLERKNIAQAKEDQEKKDAEEAKKSKGA